MSTPYCEYCEYAFDHEPGTTCEHCQLEVNEYGNTEADFRNCSFPDCGCDGARLCMAGEASEEANNYNKEGMWNSKNPVARMKFVERMYQKSKGGTP